ncbi:MAG: hypothetical protein R8G66_23170 [Cytophagales bacterium]|nr:hypothetical protein [Cytophagales bacterium]
MHTQNRILKYVVLLIVILLSSSLIAQVNPNSSPFYTSLKSSEYRWLERRNFDVQHYDGSDSLINRYLVEALQYRRNGNLIRTGGVIVSVIIFPLGIVGVAYGSQELTRGREFLHAATIRRNDLLLGGRTFEGLEEFRNRDQTRFFKRHNFHVDHYDGKSQSLNVMLNEAYRWRTRASNQFKVGLGTNVGGFGLMMLGLFSLAFGEGDGEPLITTGALVHMASYGFFISGFSKRKKARMMVRKAARTYYQQLNQRPSNPFKHLSDQ